MFSWIDVVIVLAILFYAIEGYLAGVSRAFFDLIKFAVSFFLGLRIYIFVGTYLAHTFKISQGIAYALGFFIIVFLSEIVLHVLLHYLTRKFPITQVHIRKSNHGFGFILGGIAGLLFVIILLHLFLTVSIVPGIQNAMRSSVLGNYITHYTGFLDKPLRGVFSGAAQDTMQFLTIKPKSNETLKLQFTVKGVVDGDSERMMGELVNKERQQRHIEPLVQDTTLRAVARAHAEDMLQRGYFSHYTLDGLSPFDRMEKAHILYNYAGENLAFSPTVDLAMSGLMHSEGHRENILFTHFHKIGIGVMDAGIYGKMFVQEFTD